MGLFCGKKCECKRRCKSWTGGMPDAERSCKSACDADTGLQRNDFFCSGNYVDQTQIMAQYGYDPCLGDDITFGNSIMDPGGQQAAEAQKLWIVLGVLGLFIGLAIFYYLKAR